MRIRIPLDVQVEVAVAEGKMPHDPGQTCPATMRIEVEGEVRIVAVDSLRVAVPSKQADGREGLALVDARPYLSDSEVADAIERYTLTVEHALLRVAIIDKLAMDAR